jgi:hypothetical protein
MSKNVREFINAWDAAKGNEAARMEIAEDIWYDWFCSDKALYGRTKKFIKPLKQILIRSAKAGNMEVSGKNCCPCSGDLYDCMRIFDENDKFVCCVAFDGCHYDKKYDVMSHDLQHFGYDSADEAADKMASIIEGWEA